MVNGSILNTIDRLSVSNSLTNHTGSWIGFCGTLLFVILCLILLIGPIRLYNQGSYFESSFLFDQYPKQTYYTGDDLIVAVSFRNRKTNAYANHSEIQQKLITTASYLSSADYFKIDLQLCNQQIHKLFEKSINSHEVKDCLMVPWSLKYDVEQVNGYFPYMYLQFSIKCDDIFECSTNNPKRAQIVTFIENLNKQYYYEIIFSSKIIDKKGHPKFLFNKLYSTEFNSPDALGANVSIITRQKHTYVDNSVMPWWNNATYKGIVWDGENQGSDSTSAQVQSTGMYIKYIIMNMINIAFRYYKKLDFILGMIGGAIFLLYIIFWTLFSYINRTYQKIQNAEGLFIDKDQNIFNVNNLRKIRIKFHLFCQNLLPFGIFATKQTKIIQQSQSQIDIVKIVKKLKVASRNLKTKQIQTIFQTKDLDFSQDEEDLQSLELSEKHKILDLNPQTYSALELATNSEAIYSTNSTLLSIKQSQSLPQILADDSIDKNRSKKTFKKWNQQWSYYLIKTISFFDVFGARPMFISEPTNSSCFGFCLSILIIILSILTFALTINNMDKVQFIANYVYENPQDHNYEMITGKSIRFAFCLDLLIVNNYLIGPTRSVQLTFFKYSKKFGQQIITPQKMAEGSFLNYFELSPQHPYGMSNVLNNTRCFKPIDGYTIPMGGSRETINEAYFGVRLDTYCSATPAECAQRKNQTINNFLTVVNHNSYDLFLNENNYSPKEGRLIAGVKQQAVSETNSVLDANLKRTETMYVAAIQIINDKSKSFLRQQPKSIVKTLTYNNKAQRNQERRGDPNSDPAYILEIRPNGQVQQIIQRTYKIDFLLGVIGGVFLFWYFAVNIFAKIYNSYKIRAKMAETLYQEDGCDESCIARLLYLSKFPAKLLQSSSFKDQVERVKLVDQKIQRDLHYLNLVKKIDNCFRLSTSFFETKQERNLALIGFRQKIDQAEKVKPKRIIQRKQQEGSDNSFESYDDEQSITINYQVKNKNQIGNEVMFQVNQKISGQNMLEKKIENVSIKQIEPLLNKNLPIQNQSIPIQVAKWFDLFKNPPELTLDGERDVKSVTGGLFFCINLILIVIVCAHFVGLYLDGKDFTISHQRYSDDDQTRLISDDSSAELDHGINVHTGENFKLVVAFFKKDHYYPHNVSEFIGVSIGIRMIQYTVQRVNNDFVSSNRTVEFEPCGPSYTNGFIGDYNDKTIYGNLTFVYCLPDNSVFSLRGTPLDKQITYFKVNIYNKYQNEIGRLTLNSFWQTYMEMYYMSVPRVDQKKNKFDYEMIQFNYVNDILVSPVQFNLTLTKTIFTDKFYGESRSTYNDKDYKGYRRTDINKLSSEYTRNLTFNYEGMIDRYTLDYPRGGQLFGLVGGVIALFTFIFYSFVTSFNQYRMKYLIGRKLYSFDKTRGEIKKQLAKQKNKKKKKDQTTNKKRVQKMRQKIKLINNYSELDLLKAWLLSPIGYIRDNYNFSSVLRRVTILIEKIEDDINLYNFYKRLVAVQDALNRTIKLKSGDKVYDNICVADIYLKKIFHEEKEQINPPNLSGFRKKHELSSFEQVSIAMAIDAKVNPETVLNDKTLNHIFHNKDESFSLSQPKKGQNRLRKQNLEYQSGIVSQINYMNSKTALYPLQQMSYGNLNQLHQGQDSSNIVSQFVIEQVQIQK